MRARAGGRFAENAIADGNPAFGPAHGTRCGYMPATGDRGTRRFYNARVVDGPRRRAGVSTGARRRWRRQRRRWRGTRGRTASVTAAAAAAVAGQRHLAPPARNFGRPRFRDPPRSRRGRATSRTARRKTIGPDEARSKRRRTPRVRALLFIFFEFFSHQVLLLLFQTNSINDVDVVLSDRRSKLTETRVLK